MIRLMLLAGCGGFVGTCCRYLFNRLFQTYFNTTLPWATFSVNIIGCLLVGLILGFFNRAGITTAETNAILVVGFCGGFTTFSTFSYESFTLGMGGQLFTSFLYIMASIVMGLAAVWIGLKISGS